jgi:imidazolonepropionase-like amidohydrolase
MLALMPPPLGSIELGKDADLIIFDDNLDVSWPAVQGKPRRM